MTHARKKVAAVAAAAALALTGGVIVAQPAAGAPTTPPSTEPLDYFAAAFPGLREDSVFTPVTYERFERLLDTDGTFAFLIGGPADPTTRASIAHIDAVAGELGVDTVYTFDPRLDGEAVDLRTFGEGAVGEQLRRLYTGWTNPSNGKLDEGYANLLNKDTTPQFGTPGTDPYLFVYDKNHKVGDAEDRVLASLGGTVSAEQLATAAGQSAYRAEVGAVFAALGEGGADEQSPFDFFSTAINEKHALQYPDPARYGGDVFDADDEEGFRLQSITYPELELLLRSGGEHTILFGGTWCHNTRAVIGEINRAAAASDNDTVYVFDLRIDGASGDQRHIRDTSSSLSYLYGDLVAEHFPNLRTQYRVGVDGQVDYRPGGDLAAPLASAQKLQVPYLVQYDKDRVVDGKPAPIVKDWIRDNGDGTFKEYMTEWWWVNGLPGNAPRPGQTPEQYAAAQQTAWDFADEAIEKVDAFFGLDAGPGSPSPSPSTTTSPSPEPSASASPSPSVSSSAGPDLAETGSRDPSVTVKGSVRPGGRITVTGANLASAASVRVELHSTPVVLGSATTSAAGGFSLSAIIPAATAPGVHTVVVYVDGEQVVSTQVTVAAVGLAATGGSEPAGGVAAWGAAVVIAGAAAIAIARRRRTA